MIPAGRLARIFFLNFFAPPGHVTSRSCTRSAGLKEFEGVCLGISTALATAAASVTERLAFDV